MENINIGFDTIDERTSFFNNLNSFKERIEQKYSNKHVVSSIENLLKSLNDNLVVASENESYTQIPAKDIFLVLEIFNEALSELSQSDFDFSATNNILLLAFLEKKDLIDEAIDFISEYSDEVEDGKDN
jgi:hypothetical protein